MKINPDWNYGYLRADEGYGGADDAMEAAKGFSFDALGIGEVAKAFQAGIGYFSVRDQIAAAERERRLGLRQQAGQSNSAFENLILLASQKQTVAAEKEQAAAQTDAVKNVMLGVVALGLVAALTYGVYRVTQD